MFNSIQYEITIENANGNQSKSQSRTVGFILRRHCSKRKSDSLMTTFISMNFYIYTDNPKCHTMFIVHMCAASSVFKRAMSTASRFFNLFDRISN